MDRNKSAIINCNSNFTSLSARRAWIEISRAASCQQRSHVALRKESVDRNSNPGSTTLTFPGSLSARRAWIEIDVNSASGTLSESLSARRAWIEIIDYIIDYVNDASLSARRAWIEITVVATLATLVTVALRKESVDRNRRFTGTRPVTCASLSARRAWIEILDDLRIENPAFGRSPQGERG